ncbi:hypothetical protein AOR01nite_25010 [Acetobacter orleanensis]|uniref:Uncharacterized protein n=1 Tax=Acetobacter orleanensis TaxID=104099 RepID=A0A4Y3TQH5_9PROT|nr:hypothetical protein Abol_039_016 [Acetobacter orleanensis JCM 7639]GEB84024.1 hypothetical protein AOR01nite_25010 [Acetobacter orleanensis]
MFYQVLHDFRASSFQAIQKLRGDCCFVAPYDWLAICKRNLTAKPTRETVRLAEVVQRGSRPMARGRRFRGE